MASPVIHVDISGALAGLQRVRQDQIPFATAKALTDTARLCVDAIRVKLPSQFTLRNAWTERGVTWKMATKTNPTAWVIFDRWYMYLQEVGGVRVGRRRMIAVPLDPQLRKRIPANMRPKVLMAQADLASMTSGYKSQSRVAKITASYGTGFLIHSKGSIYLAIRMASAKCKGLRTGHDPYLRILYVLVPATHIPKRLHMQETIIQTVRANFQQQFNKAMEYAIATASLTH